MAGNLQRLRALIGGVSAISFSAAALATPAAAQTVILDAITIIATKTEETAITSLAPVTVLRRDQYQWTMPNQTSDIFFGVPGVGFQMRGDDPATAINIRGLQDFGRVAVLIDGARQNHQRTGHNADGLFYLDPAVIGGVDIVRGPTSNIYGSGAIGGVVAFRTMDVEDILAPGQTWGTTHNITIGNRGRFNTSTFLAVRPNTNVDFIFGGSWLQRDNYKDGNGTLWPFTENESGTALAKTTLRLADGHEVKLHGLVGQFDFFNGQPVTAASTIYDGKVVNTIAGVRWKYSRPDDRLLDFDLHLYYTQTDATFVKILGTPSVTSGVIGDRRGFTVDTVGFDGNNTTRFDTGAIRHAFTYGIDAFLDQVSVGQTAGTASLFTPNGERTVSGGFLQLKSNHSTWLEVITALRYDHYSLTNGAFDSSGDRLSPKVTVGVTPVAGIQPYVTYAEGYRAPAVTETLIEGTHPAPATFVFLPNPALRPEVGKNKELGLNFKFDNIFRAGDGFRAKVNAFRNDIDDFIELTAIPNGGIGQGGFVCVAPIFGCQQYQNIVQGRIEGFEFESRYDTGLWYVALSGQHLRGRNAATNAPLLKIAPDQIATTVGVRLLDQRLHMAIRWAAVDSKDRGEIPPVTGTPTYPAVGSYNLVNLYVSYVISPTATANFAIENLLNEQYARYGDAYPGAGQVNTAFPSAGVVVKAGLTVKFGDMVPAIPAATVAVR
jgi:hemoglobin/transferrin/lactoferrin receptor protein